jgi:hypothetical protein
MAFNPFSTEPLIGVPNPESFAEQADLCPISGLLLTALLGTKDEVFLSGHKK